MPYSRPQSRPPETAATGPRSAPQTLVRGQRPDDPPPSERRPEVKPAGLALPSPEQLGIGSRPAEAEIDWNAFHRRLRELGSQSAETRRTPEGYCVTCRLATADPNRPQLIEARGASEAEAARLVLARAELWARGK